MDGFFVYGTLKTGEANERVILPFKVRAQEARVGGFVLHDLGHYPAARATGVETDFVYGEFVRVSAMNAALKRMDILEGYQEGSERNLYDRKVVEVELATGGTASAWIYVFARSLEERPMCEDGFWTGHRRVRREIPTEEHVVQGL